MIIINFKNYVTGKEALNLSKQIEKFLPNAIIAVPALDIENIASKTNLKVFAQHISSFSKGKHTGFLIPEFVKHDGGKGTILNHSEHRIPKKIIEKTIKETKKCGLKVVLCVENLREAKEYKKLSPWAMAFEDKKLIGSGKSITKFKTKEIKEFSKVLQKTKIIPICGAGISTAQDVITSKKLGCKGVLIASAIANVSEKKAEEVLKSLKKL